MATAKQSKLLLDANVYGEMVVDKELRKVRENFEALRKLILVYGINAVIRKELRNTPKKIKAEGKNIRNYLLVLYDNFTEEHNLSISADTENIADAYYTAYREFGGSKPKSEIINDFVIVACASRNGMDIVVSQDEKSMRTDNAIQAYKAVNEIQKIGTPKFIDYNKFKSILRSESNKLIGSPDKIWILLPFLNLLDYFANIGFFPFHMLSKSNTDINNFR
ncbi:hypothetical protein HYV80_01475 [Candidatus Woesearchaeota archaeon]|nr:hypothetical protein [Candidatus Woesearchaeota archaeon]